MKKTGILPSDREKELSALRMLLTYAMESADDIGAPHLAKAINVACEIADETSAQPMSDQSLH